MPKSAAEAFYQADAVFIGTVRLAEKDALGFDSLAIVNVESVWKGNSILGPEITVDGSGDTLHRAHIFQHGEKDIFYLRRLPDRIGQDSMPQIAFRADPALQRVVALEKATDDLKFLDGKIATENTWENRLLNGLPSCRWQICTVNAECVAVKGICGNWEAVNATFEKDAETYIQERNVSVNCVDPAAHQSSKPALECTNLICAVQQ